MSESQFVFVSSMACPASQRNVTRYSHTDDHLHRLDAAPQVVNVPGSIYKGYTTLPEARLAFADAESRGRVKVIRTGTSSDDSDDLPSAPTHPRPNRYRELDRTHNGHGVASPGMYHITRSPTPQSSPATTRSSTSSSSSRRNAAYSRHHREEQLSSPATGVSVELSYLTLSPPSGRRSTSHRHARHSGSVASPERSPRPAAEVTRRVSPATHSSAGRSHEQRLSPPTDVTQVESGMHSPPRRPDRVSSSSGAFATPSSHSTSSSRYLSLDDGVSNMRTSRHAHSRPSSSSASRLPLESPPNAAFSPQNGRASSLSSLTTGITKVVDQSSSSTQYPATTSTSSRYAPTTASSLSPLLWRSPAVPEVHEESEGENSSEGEAETRPWSPATDVTYEDLPGSPDFASTPIPALRADTDHFEPAESDYGSEHEEDGWFATAPSSPDLRALQDAEEEEEETSEPSFMSVSSSTTRSSPLASVNDALTRTLSLTATQAHTDTTPCDVRRTFSEAQVQTDHPTTLQAQVQTDTPPAPFVVQLGTGLSGDETVPASPLLSTLSPLRANALGLTQSEHIMYAAHEPAFDPRSPLGIQRSATLPARYAVFCEW